MIKYGLKLWTSNYSLFPEAVKLFEEKKIDFIELYLNPEKVLSDEELLVLKNIPVTIHHPHGFGFHEFILGEEQLRLWKETIHAADVLHTDVIVLHPGGEKTFEDFASELKKIDDPRIYLESMPGYNGMGQPMFGYKLEDLEKLHELKPICFDLCKAVKAAWRLEMDYKEYIQKAVATLAPRYFHISGCDVNEKLDQHKDVFDSDMDFSWIKRLLETISEDIRVVFETPKGEKLENDLKNMQFFREI